MHLSEEGEKATLEGTAEVLMLLKDSAGAPDARRVSLPLRFRTEIPMEGKGEARVCCRASGTRYRLSGNKLSLDFEVDFGGYLLGKWIRCGFCRNSVKHPVNGEAFCFTTRIRMNRPSL